jgi:hypothetical protein
MERANTGSLTERANDAVERNSLATRYAITYQLSRSNVPDRKSDEKSRAVDM